jgi:hypothetical protein
MKRGRLIGLNQPLMYKHPFCHSYHNFYLPLFNSVAKKKLFLGTKMVGGMHFPLPKIGPWSYT